jgi:hypothetical protein
MQAQSSDERFTAGGRQLGRMEDGILFAVRGERGGSVPRSGAGGAKGGEIGSR